MCFREFFLNRENGIKYQTYSDKTVFYLVSSIHAESIPLGTVLMGKSDCDRVEKLSSMLVQADREKSALQSQLTMETDRRHGEGQTTGDHHGEGQTTGDHHGERQTTGDHHGEGQTTGDHHGERDRRQETTMERDRRQETTMERDRRQETTMERKS